jgi:hypothetical protein
MDNVLLVLQNAFELFLSNIGGFSELFKVVLNILYNIPLSFYDLCILSFTVLRVECLVILLQLVDSSLQLIDKQNELLCVLLRLLAALF